MMLTALAQLTSARDIRRHATSRREPSITQTMSTGPTNRPRWHIDLVLEELMGADIRVAARAFSPQRWTDGELPRLMPVRQLILPDNSPTGALPVFFEGRLQRFERQIGVVVVALESPSSSDRVSEELNFFRGSTSVILQGPVVVELAFPFQVERLPAHPENYWRDLRMPRVQFEFPFPSDPDPGRRETDSDPGRQTAVMVPVSAQSPCSQERRLAAVDMPPPGAVDRLTGEDAVREEPCPSQSGREHTTMRNSNCSPATH